jgi:predicted Zn-dependent peptidase
MDISSATRTTLLNGLTVLFLRTDAIPAITVTAAVKAGAVYDPEDKVGLANVMGLLLLTGTIRRSEDEIAETIESVGGRLAVERGMESVVVVTTALSHDLGLCVELTADVLRRPTFAPDKVERVRAERISDRRSSRSDPGTLAAEHFMEEVFQGHPYHRPLNGYETTLTQIQPEDVVRFHQTYFSPDNVLIAIVGDTSEEDALRLLREHFGDWESCGVPLPEVSEVNGIDRTRAILVNKPDQTQSNLRVGHLGITRYHPDYEVVALMNYILGGGGLSTRLPSNIRTRQGLAYSVYSAFEYRKRRGPFYVNVETSNDKTAQALRSIFAEMKRLQNEPVSDEELSDATSRYIGSLPFQIQTNGQKAFALIESEFYGLGLDYLQRRNERMKQVTKEEIQRAAQAHLQPDKVIITAVSKAEEVREQLEEFGAVEVRDVQ